MSLTDHLLSVIIPVYNSERTLCKCVDSVLSQAISDFELILVNDGSNDESGKICDDYSAKDKRVSVIHKANGGVSSARNTGIDTAVGKWICFIDSDDYVDGDFFARLAGYHEDLLITNAIVENGSRRSFFWRHPLTHTTITDIKEITSFIDRQVAIFKSPIGKFYRRDLINDLRFNTNLRIGEDAEFVYNYLTKCSSLAMLPECTYVVRDYYGIPTYKKYGMPTPLAIEHVRTIFVAYQNLTAVFHLDHGNFAHMYFFFKLLCKNDWEKHPYKWYCDNEVRHICKYIYSSLSAKQKATETVAYLISKVIKPFK